MNEAKRLTIWLAAAAAAAVPVQAQPAPGAQPGAPLAFAPPPTRALAQLSVGELEDFTRLSFIFPAAATMTLGGRDGALELRFSRAVDIDLAEVRTQLPRFVRGIERVSAAGEPLRIALRLEEGVRERHFIDGLRVNVDLLAPPPRAPETATPATAPAAPPPPPPPPPYVPPRGTGAVSVAEDATASRITVRWDGPARAAAFRRGEAIWILFQADGRLDLRNIARAGRRFSDMEVVRGEGVIGLRLPVSSDTFVAAAQDGAAWTFTLSARATPTPAAPVRLDAAAGNRLEIAFGRQGAVSSVVDPEIGDRLIVGFISGAPIGVAQRRATLEAAILPSALGAVIEPRADGVEAMFHDGALMVARGAGLMALPPAALQPAPAPAAAGALTPVLSDRQIRDRIDALTRAAAAEGASPGAPATARMALARFLLANELAPETLGALRVAEINQPEIELDPEFRLMRAAAKVMMHRRDAHIDLSAAALLDNPAAALWRGYLAAESQNWSEALREFARGEGALETQPANWRARFALARAQAAVELDDLDEASEAARTAIGEAQSQPLRLEARLVEARVLAADGRADEAKAIFAELSSVRDEEVAVRAQLEAVKLSRRLNAITPAQAADTLEALRYRWRGDAVEIETVATLGRVYAEMQRWRDALVTMRVVANRFPDAPQARLFHADMQEIFKRLFLDGGADELEPIQAVGLFYEFADLTPIGRDGDRLVRKLSGRLVAVDLLEQAAVLLQHQVDERLDGVGRAEVGGDLAAIYLMDRKAEQALIAITATRQANLPPALLAERRILEARAHLDLNRLDHAVELVERDRGLDAQRVRAEAAWRARDWTKAGAELRTLLALRPQAQPMDQEWRRVTLRAAVALSLSEDEPALRQLYRDYAGDMAGTEEAPAFEIAAAGVNPDGMALRELARAIGRADLVDRFLSDIRSRMTGGAPAPAAPDPGA